MARIPFGTVVSRAFRLRCPQCAGGRLFAGPFKMYANCPNCKLRYEREAGYFLGSAYINYALTAMLLTTAYVVLHFVAGIENRILAGPLGLFVVLFPLFFFRYARSLWLAVDCYFDIPEFDDGPD